MERVVAKRQDDAVSEAESGRSLVVGAVDDPAERDADRLADQVIARIAAGGSQGLPASASDPTAGRIARTTSPVIRRNGGDDVATAPRKTWSEAFCEAVALQIREEIEAKLHERLYKGLGGGGTKGPLRSKEVKQFRGELKKYARTQAYSDLQAYANKRFGKSGKTATTDYLEMVGGNIAYKMSKKSVDAQMRTEEQSLVRELGPMLDTIYRVALREATVSYAQTQGDPDKAMKAAATAAEPLLGPLEAEARRIKDRVVGKRDESGERTGDGWAMTDDGKGVGQRVAERTEKDEVGRKSLQKAIEAPSMSAGLRILGHLIDGIVNGPGETVELAIEFSIPTSVPSLVVVIKMSGMAARGTNGATTAGVTVLGDPKRVEVAAKFSVGVGAEAVGLKSDGSVGFVVRAGSDKGTDAALQALSYGAYRAAPGPIADLWAPADKMGGRSAVHRAEMWAAMIEETIFDAGLKKSERDDTFADLGGTIEGGFGVNAGAVEINASIGETIFKRYDAASLAASLGKTFGKSDFGARVKTEADAKRRRKNAAGELKLALAAGVSFKAGIGGNSVEFGLAVSGSNPKNWGCDVTATVGMPPGVDSNWVDQLINQYATSIGEAAKRTVEILRRFGEKERGFYGAAAQMPVDATAILDARMGGQLAEAIKGISSNTVDKSAFDTPVGETFAGGTEQLEVFSPSTQLEFFLTFGMNDGEFVVRVEVRSSRGIDINAGTVAKVSASKKTRLIALGRDGAKGAVFEVAGVRIDSKDE